MFGSKVQILPFNPLQVYQYPYQSHLFALLSSFHLDQNLWVQRLWFE